MITNLNNESLKIDTSKDSIVIVDNQQSIKGGVTLDTTGFTPDVIQAGHIIIKELVTSEHRPMPLNTEGTAYGQLPAGYSYDSILLATILTAKPFAGLLLKGSVNEKATPFPIPSEAKQAMPFILFTSDK